MTGRIVTACFFLALTPACAQRSDGASAIGDPEHGAALIAQHQCGSCHLIPGVDGARARIGPSLEDIADQQVLAGLIPNTPDNMATWIRRPQSISPGNVMPDMEFSDDDARDIAAYLYTLH